MDAEVETSLVSFRNEISARQDDFLFAVAKELAGNLGEGI